MTRLELETRFREENPEMTTNVIPASTLHSWCQSGDKEVCARTRVIVDDDTITAVEDQARYDLTALDNFYDIDEMPGGGVSRVDSSGRTKRLIKTTMAELDDQVPSWRTASSGAPKYYYRRGKYMHVYPKPDSTITGLQVYFVAISDPFNNDNISPYNQLTYLEPFHDAILFYLVWRAKAKVGKPEDAQNAMTFYNNYVAWMKKEVGGGKYGPIELRPQGLPSSGYQR